MTEERNGNGKVKREMEYEEMRKLGKQAGIEDLISLHEEYQRWMQIATRYLKEMDMKFTATTTDSTSQEKANTGQSPSGWNIVLFQEVERCNDT